MRTLVVVAALVLAACGGGGGSAPAATAEPAEPAPAGTEGTTAVTEPPSTEPAGGGAAGATVTDPADDLVDAFDETQPCADPAGSFDVAEAAVEAGDDGFTVTLRGHVPGPLQQVRIAITTPGGEFYDIRARADGNSTVDGGGPYAWDSGAVVTLEGADDAYTVSVTKIALDAGSEVELVTRSGCGDVVDAVLG